MIRIMHHASEFLPCRCLYLGSVRGGGDRYVRQDCRLIEKKGFVPVTTHEIDRVFGKDIGSEPTGGVDFFPIANHIRVPVTFLVSS